MKQLLTTLLIFSHIITATEIKQESDPLLTLISAEEKMSTELTHWEVIIKEKITSKKAYNEIVANLTKNDKTQQRKGHQPGTVIHEMTQKEGAITISQQLLSPGDDADYAERIVVIEGDYFDEVVRSEYESIRRTLFAEIAIENSRTFTCIQFIDDGTIVNESVLKYFVSELEVLHSKIQVETIENSMVKKQFYGYTPLLKQDFMIDGQSYNLQIAEIEQADNKLEYMIGTPILVNEY